jgi:microcystin-dependent protein
MSESFMGEIRMVGFNFAPVGWALCNGQLLSIAQNEALFNLIGTTYGGDGHTTFALPNLQSRVPMHQGNGHGLGEMGGAEQVTLNVSQLPTHIHLPQATQYYGGTSSDPTGNIWAMSEASKQYVAGDQPNAPMSPAAMARTGGGRPHDNMLPYQAIYFVIALAGLYPSQG